MKKIVIETDQAPAAIGPYTQALAAGPFVFISGQIPWTPTAAWWKATSWCKPSR